MHIVFFSTNANSFSPSTFRITKKPAQALQWQSLAQEHREHKFTLVTQEPCMFLADINADGTVSSAQNVECIVCKKNSVNEISALILEQKPDVAVAASFWQPPYDWNCLKDAMIAEALNAAGIKTVCHPAKTMHTCFDKTLTENFLRANGFFVPKSVHVNHELFWAERGNTQIKTNVYKEYVLSRIKSLNFPVIIKDTVGLSSYGMCVANTYAEAVHYLRSGKSRSDRIVQEYITGEQFGLEVYGSPSSYTVLPPFAFSVNRFGITSPKQGIKTGPAQKQDSLHLKELNTMILSLAQKLELNGAAQIDLIFSEGKWCVLEINPRLSGMSETYACAYGTDIPHVLFSLATGQNPFSAKPLCVCNFKLPLLSDKEQSAILQNKNVHFVRQTQNLAAKQEREKGYCEIVLGSGENLAFLKQELLDFADKNPRLIDRGFLTQAEGMIDFIGF